MGEKATATGESSLALGKNAKATANNSTALGSDSVADRADTVSIGSTNRERQLTNVAAGTQATDGVNVAQLNKTVGQARDYTDTRFNQLKKDLHKQDDTLSAGIAGAMAMASLPQPYVAGASLTGVGVSNYRGQSAIAAGVSHVSDNGHWVSKLQASTSTQGDTGVSVGVGYQW